MYYNANTNTNINTNTNTDTHTNRRRGRGGRAARCRRGAGPAAKNILHSAKGVQWKQGVVIHMTLYTSLLHNTTPIHCTPDPLHPPLQSVQT